VRGAASFDFIEWPPGKFISFKTANGNDLYDTLRDYVLAVAKERVALRQSAARDLERILHAGQSVPLTPAQIQALYRNADTVIDFRIPAGRLSATQKAQLETSVDNYIRAQKAIGDPSRDYDKIIVKIYEFD
jgi:hypothetical protein